MDLPQRGADNLIVDFRLARVPVLLQPLAQHMGQEEVEKGRAGHPGTQLRTGGHVHLDYGDGEFDAAFSMFGVMYFGTETAESLAEMARVVRTAGIVGVVHWAVPEGAPYFTILGRAVNRFDDPEVGQFTVPLSENLKRSELEDALGKAGCVDAR